MKETVTINLAGMDGYSICNVQQANCKLYTAKRRYIIHGVCGIEMLHYCWKFKLDGDKLQVQLRNCKHICFGFRSKENISEKYQVYKLTRGGDMGNQYLSLIQLKNSTVRDIMKTEEIPIMH